MAFTCEDTISGKGFPSDATTAEARPTGASDASSADPLVARPLPNSDVHDVAVAACAVLTRRRRKVLALVKNLDKWGVGCRNVSENVKFV